WLILVLVTPLIIVAVVLLYGFVGCGTELTLDDDSPNGVTNLTGKAIDVDRIVLAWLNDLDDVAKYVILRAEKNPPLAPITTLSDVTSPPFIDAPATGLLKEGTTFIYQVSAINSAGVPLTGGLSNESRTTTLPTAPTLEAIPLDVDKIKLNWTNK